MLHAGSPIPPFQFSAAFGVAATAYFWWTNIKGRSRIEYARRIMQITTPMVVMFLLWCGLTLLKRGPAQIPSPPLPSNLDFSNSSADLGWLAGTRWIRIPAVIVIVAFGHSVGDLDHC